MDAICLDAKGEKSQEWSPSLLAQSFRQLPCGL